MITIKKEKNNTLFLWVSQSVYPKKALYCIYVDKYQLNLFIFIPSAFSPSILIFKPFTVFISLLFILSFFRIAWNIESASHLHNR